jgi:hypothetical protein
MDHDAPMPFGMHKGTPMRSVPLTYLRFLDQHLNAAGATRTPAEERVLQYIDKHRSEIDRQLKQMGMD